MNDLVNAEWVCRIVDGSSYDMVTLLMAWHAMKCVEWEAFSSISTSLLLPFVMNIGTVFVFPEKGSTRVVQNARTAQVLQSRGT